MEKLLDLLIKLLKIRKSNSKITSSSCNTRNNRKIAGFTNQATKVMQLYHIDNKMILYIN